MATMRKPPMVVPKRSTMIKLNPTMVAREATGERVGQLRNTSQGAGTRGQNAAVRPPVVRPGSGLLGTKASRGNWLGPLTRRPVVVHAATGTPKAGTDQNRY